MASQLLVISILEFGAVFHSFLVGLTLGTAKHIVMLLVVLVFHQIFEGLGLGARLAVAPWPANRHYVPYVLAGVFSLATPVGVAVGLGVQPKSADTQKLVGGIFSAISAGILMYTGLVELFARELLFGMSTGSPRMIAIAFGSVAFGMAAMSLLAKWA
jgi:zinc transporter 1/2/3